MQVVRGALSRRDPTTVLSGAFAARTGSAPRHRRRAVPLRPGADLAAVVPLGSRDSLELRHHPAAGDRMARCQATPDSRRRPAPHARADLREVHDHRAHPRRDARRQHPERLAQSDDTFERPLYDAGARTRGPLQKPPAARKALRGRVTNAQGQPLRGALVAIGLEPFDFGTETSEQPRVDSGNGFVPRVLVLRTGQPLLLRSGMAGCTRSARSDSIAAGCRTCR